MGWSFCYSHRHRTEVVDDLVKSWSNPTSAETIAEFKLPLGDYRTENECLKHCYRGGMRSGTLWSVWERRVLDNKTNQKICFEKYILCHLLKYDPKDMCWGEKVMSESSGPYVDSCPLSYLDMVPIPIDKDGNPQEYAVEFRKRVRARANTYKPKLLERVSLRDCTIPWAIIVSLRPLMGRDENDRLCKIPRHCIVGTV